MSKQEHLTSPAEFLHDRDPNLQKSPEVTHVVDYLNQNGAEIPNNPSQKIDAYLNFLGEVVDDGLMTGNESSIDRQVEHLLVNPDDVPENYFDFQKRILREQGYGDVSLNEEERSQLVETARNDQRGRLDEWATYLSSEDAGYPSWFKYYAWTSVNRLKPFNPEDQSFKRRSKGTTAAFPELNPEALAMVYDLLVESKLEGKELDDKEIQEIVKSGNFAKLYGRAIKEAGTKSSEALDTVEGSWTKFEQTADKASATKLSKSLAKHATGWCTAGEAVAASQLRQGDFYVYYTKDKKGNDTIPRIAVRMSNGKVVEVRGTLPGQALEPELMDIALDQIRDLPGGDSYVEIAADMKRLTRLDNLLVKTPAAEISAEDIKFLYEIDKKIIGFGYHRDPRTLQILKKRNVVEDLQKAGIVLDQDIIDRFHRDGLFAALLTNIETADEQSSIEVNRYLKTGKFRLPSQITDALDPNKPVNLSSLINDIMQVEDNHNGVEYYVNNFGLEPIDAFKRMIETGSEATISNAVFGLRSSNVDIQDALFILVDNEEIGTVFEYMNGFAAKLTTEQRQHLSEYMLKSGQEDQLVRYLEQFPEVDRKELASTLLESGKHSPLFWYLHKFPELDRERLAELVLKDENISPLNLVYAIKRFPELGSSEVAKRLFAAGEVGEIIRNFEDFKDLDPAEVINFLIENDKPVEALGLIRGNRRDFITDEFPKLDAQDIAAKLIANGKIEFVRRYYTELKLTRDQVFEMELASLPKRKRAARRIKKMVLSV